jgi:hypothetical protein
MCRPRGNRRDAPPRHPDEGTPPSTCIREARMSAPEHGSSEGAAPAGEAPAIIYLPHLPPPTEPIPQRRNGRPISTKPGSQISRRRRVADPKDRVITFRCTVAEYELLETRATAMGLAIGPYLRQRETGTTGPRAHRNPGEATKLLSQILAQLGKSGSNLNQGIRAVHQINIVAGEGEKRDRLAELIDDMAERHRQAIAEHRECVAAILRALGLRPDADHY